MTTPTAKPGHLNYVEATSAEVTATTTRRWDVYHFIEGLRFHLYGAESNLRYIDKQLRKEKRLAALEREAPL